MSETKSFPFDIRRFTEEENSYAFKDIDGGFKIEKYMIRVGPHGYCLKRGHEALLPKIHNLELRPDDVFVVSFPKTGSHWTQELVWLTANDFDFNTASTVRLIERFPFLEYSALYTNDILEGLLQKASEQDEGMKELATRLNEPIDNSLDTFSKMRSRRFIKTHLPLSILPPNILEKTKVVYVARDPRDVAVSYFHHYRAFVVDGYKGEFKDFWELFKKDMVMWSPYLAHFREAWALRDHPNILLLFYEELSKDLPDTIRRVAKFLGKDATEEQIARLAEHLKFDNFKNNNMVNYQILKDLGLFRKDEVFVRKGKVGGWRDYFDEDMAKDAQQWIEEGLKGIDFKFPDF